MFDNQKEWMSLLRKGVQNLENNVVRATDDANFRVFQKTSEFTPTDTGALASSRRTETNIERGYVEATLTYNEDGSAPYAILQHENPDFDHNKPWNPPQAQYRFLARAYEEELGTIRRIYRNEVKF